MTTPLLPRAAFAIVLALLLANHRADASPKPKYGPQAVLLRDAREHIARTAAPDFWALMPYYAAQQTGSACTVASVAMMINAARVRSTLTADDALATQNDVLKKTDDEEWTKSVGEKGRGRSLEQLGPTAAKAMKAYGFANATAEVIHVDDLSSATRKRVHDALVANERSDSDFILANFNQAAYTGDAEVGHVAPVAAYDAKAKRVLILDPDREWYEPYWVSEETFLKGLNTTDKGAGKSRGIVWVKRDK